MKKSKLAVVFPVYNGEKTLEKSLRCIAEQDYRDFKAYIVENASTDRSLEIATAFCADDPRFEVIICGEHLDAHANFIRSMKVGQAKGEFFCLRACDDLSTPDYLSKLIAALEADKTKLVAVGSAERIDLDGTKRILRPNQATLDFYENLKVGRVAKSLFFPAEWLYGVFRSEVGGDILISRWKAYGTAWCAASFSVAAFVILGKAVWIDGPSYHFYEGSGSESRYMVSGLRDKIFWRWKYAKGCFSVIAELDELSLLTRLKIWRMCWRDAGRKTRYRIRRHIRSRLALG